jgi:hypothetical protein
MEYAESVKPPVRYRRLIDAMLTPPKTTGFENQATSFVGGVKSEASHLRYLLTILRTIRRWEETYSRASSQGLR